MTSLFKLNGIKRAWRWVGGFGWFWLCTSSSSHTLCYLCPFSTICLPRRSIKTIRPKTASIPVGRSRSSPAERDNITLTDSPTSSPCLNYESPVRGEGVKGNMYKLIIKKPIELSAHWVLAYETNDVGKSRLFKGSGGSGGDSILNEMLIHFAIRQMNAAL